MALMSTECRGFLGLQNSFSMVQRQGLCSLLLITAKVDSYDDKVEFLEKIQLDGPTAGGGGERSESFDGSAS